MKFVLKFSKEGYIKYTSHLDMIRLFKRAFKKSGIHLQHSQGFNPHPKMTFAQPLSLGYTSLGEIIEIETKEDFEPSMVISQLQNAMPEGINILSCDILSDNMKNIAGKIEEAEYTISVDNVKEFSEKTIDDFLMQDKIIVLKKQKKKKELKEVDIKSKIRSLSGKFEDDKLFMTTKVDCGSVSNLNPDLLLKAFLDFAGIELKAENIEIQRNYLK